MNEKRKILAIIGAGGHGKVLADTALESQQWRDVVFLDDSPQTATQVAGISVLGNSQLLHKLMPSEYDVAVAIGNNAIRKQIFQNVRNLGFDLPAIIHPSAVVSRLANIGSGSVIFAQAVIQAGSVLEDGVIANTSCSIDHDCRIQAFAHISPGVHLAGGTQVGTESWLGIASCTRQLIRIGNRVTVGAGAVVVSDIGDDLTVVGNPAKPLQRNAV